MLMKRNSTLFWDVTSEHTIEILKACFPFLCSMCIECCIILHNLLIDVSEDTVPKECWDSADDASEIGSALVGEHELVATILHQDKEESYFIVVKSAH